jgi:hypothetical protein
MKKMYKLLCLIFVAIGMNAQVVLTPVNLSSTISEATEHVYTLTLTNNGSSPVNVWWQINKGANFPTNWKAFFCDDNFCYTPAVEFTPANRANTIAAKSTVKWTFHLDPSSQTGSGKVQVQFFSDSQRRTLLAETLKDAVITADKSLNTKNIGKAIDIKISPNPTTDYFSLQNDNAVSKLAIYNIVGKEVEIFKHATGNLYNVADYPNGIYVIKMLDSRGRSIKSLRLKKN